MASSLLSSGTLGNVSASSLVRSAGTLQREIATFQDNAARIAYENSGHTDEAYQAYVNYLQGRVKTLSASSSITDLNKAQSLQQEIVTATHSNVSYQIQQENMRLMATGDAGTVAGYQSKMQVVADEFNRATAIGDNTLAYSLQNQYYSLSQSMQQAQTTAANAATTLQKANASYEGDVIASLQNGLKELNAGTKGSSLQEFNAMAKAWVQQNKDALGALGVKVDTNTQPNYFDLVNAVQGAIYNHTVLQAQAIAPYDPNGAQVKLQDAQNMLNGTAKVTTLAGDMTAQEVQQAAQDPAMFAYDASTGTFKRTAQVGFHYMTDQNGQQTLVPTYSGIVGDAQRNNVYFLTPQQTTMMSKLGLAFSENKNGTTGDGVQVQATAQTPQWLKQILGGDNAVTSMYTDQNGQLTFRAGASSGNGFSAYILSGDGSGRFGILEQTAEGTTVGAGGDLGFNFGTAQNLINQGLSALSSSLKIGQSTLPSTGLSLGHTQPASLRLAAAPSLPTLKVATPSLPAVPQLQSATVSPQPAAPVQVQPTATPQPRTTSPQIAPTNGFSLNMSGSGGIPLGRL